uniref:protein PSK SIMULATOR 1-like n=1 Tax=Erigeron canadensis TaxID=72917 RepID=UPI001CB8DBB1|nr:protein PSK SIMULATOR 1-like [Erigeron canadensis]
MVLETWLFKVKKTISHSFDSIHVTTPPPSKKSTCVTKRSKVGVLAFEIAGIMPKLTHMWRFLSDENMDHLRNHSICLEGVRKLVSNKDAFLLGLACAEMVENLRIVALSVSRLSKRCEDLSLAGFETTLDAFANTGHDPCGWALNLKDMEIKIKKMERYVATTAALYREMDELTIIENNIKKSLNSKKDHHHHDQEVINTCKQQKILDLQQKLIWQKQQIKYVKEKSLWNRSFDSITSLLATSIFTILSRIKIVFGITQNYPASLPRSLSASATVYPSDQTSNSWHVSLIKSTKHQENKEISLGFFEINSKILKPLSNTLGAAALALHYANLIIVMEKMIRSPQLVGLDARDDLYSMLPNSIRSSLRGRLKGIGFTATDPVLAGEWREALNKILGWLSPLAHNMIKWQSERSFEHQNRVPKTNVLLLKTLYFANQEKTEAAIAELLVGLNYIWRFEREMNAKALFNCSSPVK